MEKSPKAESPVSEAPTLAFTSTAKFFRGAMATPFPNQIVTLRKGSQVFSCHPRKKSYELARRQRVKVHAYYPALPPEGYGHPERKAQVHWAGTGGYWCWTNVENIVTDEN